MVVDTKSNLLNVFKVNAAFAANELMIPLVAGYTSKLFALVFMIVIRIPAIAVGSTT